MEILLILLGLSLLAVLIWIILLKRDVKSFSKRIKDIANSEVVELLEKEEFDNTAADLVDSVNILLERKKDNQRENQRAKSTLRDAINKIANNNKLKITQMLHMLQSIFSQDTDIDIQMENLEIIKEELTKLILYADKLIEYANVIEGNIATNITQNNICNIVRDTLAERRVELNDRQITVYGDIPDNPIMCLCDEDVLKSVLRYLLRNVCVHGKEMLEININGGIIEISNKADGLNEADVANIFDCFTDTNTSDDPGKHMGLGLAISKGLIELMKGRIAAELMGDVLTIRITLPLLTTQRSNNEKVEDFRVKT